MLRKKYKGSPLNFFFADYVAAKLVKLALTYDWLLIQSKFLIPIEKQIQLFANIIK